MKINKVKVIEIMKKNGISTQTALAHTMGITKNQLSVILSNKYTPFKSNVLNLCKALNIELEEIIEVDCKTNLNFENNSNDITAIELFAGAGGLALGLEKAGINSIQHIEIDKFCCETLRRNRPLWNVIESDISTVDFSKYRNKIDIVTGGSPCQAFSYSGKKLGFEDTRGTLFYQFARCVNQVQPKIFMFENVRGLISHDKGRTLDTILSVFKELKYSVKYKVLNANDFGVAQKRERIIIIGTKKGISFSYPKPLNDKPVLKDVLKNVPNSAGQSYSEKKKNILSKVPAGGCWINLPLELQKEYLGASFYSGGGKRGMARRISWDEPSLTLTCSPSQKQTERCHPDETRPFTVREYARIQSFPDDWQFSGGIGSQYKQIGNAVPVELAYHIAKELVISISNFRKSYDPSKSILIQEIEDK